MPATASAPLSRDENTPDAPGKARPQWNITDALWLVFLEGALFILIFNVPEGLERAGTVLTGWDMAGAGKFFAAVSSALTPEVQALARLISGTAAVWYALKMFGAEPADFGIRPPRAGLRWTVVFTAALAGLYIGGGLLLLHFAPGYVKGLIPLGAIRKMGAAWAITAYCVSAPLVEETIYRGALYPAMKKRWGRNAAIVLSAAVFALMHNVLSWTLFIPAYQFAGGLIFAYAYEKSGSLAYPAIYHACGNGLLFAAWALLR